MATSHDIRQAAQRWGKATVDSSFRDELDRQRYYNCTVTSLYSVVLGAVQHTHTSTNMTINITNVLESLWIAEALLVGKLEYH